MTFSSEEITKVWESAVIVRGISPDIYRKDECGAWIAFNEFGNTNSSLGWEIGYINPNLNGERDEIKNLRPLHWENSRAMVDGKLVCVVSTDWQKVAIRQVNEIESKIKP